jgi:hypothetical protein
MTTKTVEAVIIQGGSERKFAGLRRFKPVMGFLHLIQGIFMILVSNDTTYPILRTS